MGLAAPLAGSPALRTQIEQQVPITAITSKFADAYREHMGALGVDLPDLEPHATAHIPQIIAMIEALIAEAKRNATVTMLSDGVLMRLNKQDFIGREAVVGEDTHFFANVTFHARCVIGARGSTVGVGSYYGEPTGIVGGRVPEWDGNLRLGGDALFVVEADEFDRSFLTLRPSIAVLTSGGDAGGMNPAVRAVANWPR